MIPPPVPSQALGREMSKNPSLVQQAAKISYLSCQAHPVIYPHTPNALPPSSLSQSPIRTPSLVIFIQEGQVHII